MTPVMVNKHLVVPNCLLNKAHIGWPYFSGFFINLSVSPNSVYNLYSYTSILCMLESLHSLSLSNSLPFFMT